MRFVSDGKLKEINRKLNENEVDVAIFADFENNRDINVKFLTGHPGDAFVALVQGEVILIPWDVQLAEKFSTGCSIIKPEEFNHSYVKALVETLKKKNQSEKLSIAVGHGFSYRYVNQITTKFTTKEVTFDVNLLHQLMYDARAVKTADDITRIKKGMGFASKIVDQVEEYINDENNPTEVDVAFFAEVEGRKLGAEKVSFDTICANSSRSWAIHAHPPAGRFPLKRPGLALMDHGFVFDNFCTDITIPFVFGKVTTEMKKAIDTVQLAHDASLEVLAPGVRAHEVSQIAVDIIEKAGFTMPHSLGHGLGLVVHDSPVLRQKPETEAQLKNWTETVLEAGMIVTIEPGVYPKSTGGTRLENDFLITATGHEMLTNSRYMYF